MTHQVPDKRIRPGLVVGLVFSLLIMLSLGVYWTTRNKPSPAGEPVATEQPPAPSAPAATAPSDALEQQWGFKVAGVGLSKTSAVVDLHCEVVAPEKIALLATGKVEAFLIDLTSGARIPIGAPPQNAPRPPSRSALPASPPGPAGPTVQPDPAMPAPGSSVEPPSTIRSAQDYRNADAARRARVQEARKMRWAAIAAANQTAGPQVSVLPSMDQLAPGATYSISVPNLGGLFKRGSRVALVIGGLQSGEITVTD